MGCHCEISIKKLLCGELDDTMSVSHSLFRVQIHNFSVVPEWLRESKQVPSTQFSRKRRTLWSFVGVWTSFCVVDDWAAVESTWPRAKAMHVTEGLHGLLQMPTTKIEEADALPNTNSIPKHAVR